jgi:multidrug efflux pump subunit AcrA (membrane-fusion protein)
MTMTNTRRKTTTTDFAAERRKIEEANAQQQQRLAELAQQEKAEYEQQQAQLKEEREEMRTMAKNYRAMALEAPDKARADELVRYAIECDEKAARIIIDGEIPAEPEVKIVEKPKPQPWQRPVLIGFLIVLQAAVAALAMLISENGFRGIGEQIMHFNEKVSIDQRIRPYDLSNWQKLYYAVFVEFSDVPKALFKMFIFVPFLLWYLFRGFVKDFFENLTPYQRCLILVLLLLGFLFHSSFGVKL